MDPFKPPLWQVNRSQSQGTQENQPALHRQVLATQPLSSSSVPQFSNSSSFPGAVMATDVTTRAASRAIPPNYQPAPNMHAQGAYSLGAAAPTQLAGNRLMTPAPAQRSPASANLNLHLLSTLLSCNILPNSLPLALPLAAATAASTAPSVPVSSLITNPTHAQAGTALMPVIGPAEVYFHAGQQLDPSSSCSFRAPSLFPASAVLQSGGEHKPQAPSSDEGARSTSHGARAQPPGAVAGTAQPGAGGAGRARSSPGQDSDDKERDAGEGSSRGREEAAGSGGAGRGRGAQRLVFTRESLKPLFGLPHAEAAARLEMSTRSLTSLCKRLGIRKWPYKQRPPP